MIATNGYATLHRGDYSGAVRDALTTVELYVQKIWGGRWSANPRSDLGKIATSPISRRPADYSVARIIK
ncbi:hypothetical protein [Pseudorhodoplanes sp.]|uniref:hypothetical protein n=1 Tax=Pseudorhodoplanes sp. TaxID=1934341 RepID=UPI003D1035B8